MTNKISFYGADPSAIEDYAVFIRNETYDGNIEIDADEASLITVEKTLLAPISVIRIISNTGITHHRSWQNVQRNKSAIRVMWFIKKGHAEFVGSRSTISAHTGEAVIVDPNIPYHARASIEDGSLEAILAIIPAHLFCDHVQKFTYLDHAFAIETNERRGIEAILDLIGEVGESLSPNAIDFLTRSLLEEISECVPHAHDMPSSGRRISDQRLEQVKAYILRNLSDPGMKYSEVAQRCGISPRYLYRLLEKEGTSFSRFVWRQRLEKAREWLSSPELASHSIHEIAFMTGFRDASHFSRAFRASFGCSPRQFRTESAHFPKSQAHN